jgi:hypothetical protein
MSVKDKRLVGDLVEKLRSEYPTAPRKLLRSHIRLQLEHRKVEFNDAMQKQLDRALDKAFPKQQKPERTQQPSDQVLPSQEQLRLRQNIEDVKRAFASDSIKAMKFLQMTYSTLPPKVKTKVLPTWEDMRLDYETLKKSCGTDVPRLPLIDFANKWIPTIIEIISGAMA